MDEEEENAASDESETVHPDVLYYERESHFEKPIFARRQAYATIDPYRDKLKVRKGLSSTVAAALNTTLQLFNLMSIQNNLAENINSFLRAVLKLTGPKTIESVEQRIRATLKVRNHPELLEDIIITRKIRANFLYNNSAIQYF